MKNYIKKILDNWSILEQSKDVLILIASYSRSWRENTNSIVATHAIKRKVSQI